MSIITGNGELPKCWSGARIVQHAALQMPPKTKPPSVGEASLVIECARCRQTFEWPKSRGAIRKYCDICRGPRIIEMRKSFRYRARIKGLKDQLRIIVRELVNEALIEMGTLKRANGAGREE